MIKEFHDDQEWDIHSAHRPSDCAKIGKRLGKKTIAINGPFPGELPWDCIYAGPQTSFEDNRSYSDQDSGDQGHDQ